MAWSDRGRRTTRGEYVSIGGGASQRGGQSKRLQNVENVDALGRAPKSLHQASTGPSALVRDPHAAMPGLVLGSFSCLEVELVPNV